MPIIFMSTIAEVNIDKIILFFLQIGKPILNYRMLKYTRDKTDIMAKRQFILSNSYYGSTIMYMPILIYNNSE